MTNDEMRTIVVWNSFRLLGWVIVGAIIIGSIIALRPIVELIAGKTTEFQVSIVTTVSAALNIAGVATISGYISSNKKLRKRIVELEAQRPASNKSKSSKSRPKGKSSSRRRG